MYPYIHTAWKDVAQVGGVNRSTAFYRVRKRLENNLINEEGYGSYRVSSRSESPKSPKSESPKSPKPESPKSPKPESPKSPKSESPKSPKSKTLLNAAVERTTSGKSTAEQPAPSTTSRKGTFHSGHPSILLRG